MVEEDTVSKPLDGVRVLDLTRNLSGPLATMILADLGADVAKVEKPIVGDDTRHWGPPFYSDAGPTFIGYNRGKRSVVLDLSEPDDVATLRRLSDRSDVLVENFRPGTMVRFGLGYDKLAESNARLIYCSISGYGTGRSLAGKPAMDLLVQAVGGLISLTGPPEGPGYKAAAPVADVMAGLSAAISILAALRKRDSEGVGQRIDISMLDSILMLMGQSIATISMNHSAPERLGNAHALMAPYQTYAAEDREIAVAVTNQKTWDALCGIPEFQGLGAVSQYATTHLRSVHRMDLNSEMSKILSSKSAAHWLGLFDEAKVPAEVVRTLPEILESNYVTRGRSVTSVEYPSGDGADFVTAGYPWADVCQPTGAAIVPSLGEDSDEVTNPGFWPRKS
jgi:crotonobetainyl-CoA:carnitine CoA-transferase CaiB-like acyl-CoA transferase